MPTVVGTVTTEMLVSEGNYQFVFCKDHIPQNLWKKVGPFTLSMFIYFFLVDIENLKSFAKGIRKKVPTLMVRPLRVEVEVEVFAASLNIL